MLTANLNDVVHRLAGKMVSELLSHESDRQLVERALNHQDLAAMQTIISRHGSMVYRVCLRVLRHTQDAEDAFQATFLVLATKLRTLRKHNSLASWLHGVAYRVATKARNQAAARHQRDIRASVTEAIAPEDSSWNECLAILDAELQQLPDKWRLPLVLCYLEGQTQDEAATRLMWSKRVLRCRLEEAREALARRLTARGITLPAALSAVLLSECATCAVPATQLVAGAVETMSELTTGKALAQVASAPVAALTGGVLKTMFVTKLKSVALALASVCFAVGIGRITITQLHARSTMISDVPAQSNCVDPPTKDDSIAKLVSQLGSPEFAEREAAQKALRELGNPAVPALRLGLKSDNLEIRNRSAAILAGIRKDSLETLLKEFDRTKDKQPEHPVWKRYVAIAGNTAASRELFARIIANKKWIQTLDKAEADHANAGHVYRVGIAEMFRDFHNDPAKSPPWPCDRAEEVAYLLLLGSYPDENPTAKLTGDEIVPENLRNTSFLGRGIIRGEAQILHANGLDLGLRGQLMWHIEPNPTIAAALPGTDRVFARLLAAWLERRDPASEVVPTAFRIAFWWRVPEILPIARRYAANDFKPKREIPLLATIASLQLLAQRGTKEDLPLFERHFRETANVAAIDKPSRHEILDYHRPEHVTETTQLRDVALGLALLLHGANPADFGFVVRKDIFVQDKNGRYAIPWSIQTHLGFATDADRDAAHVKAKDFFDKQRKTVIPAKSGK